MRLRRRTPTFHLTWKLCATICLTPSQEHRTRSSVAAIAGVFAREKNIRKKNAKEMHHKPKYASESITHLSIFSSFFFFFLFAPSLGEFLLFDSTPAGGSLVIHKTRPGSTYTTTRPFRKLYPGLYFRMKEQKV